MVMSAHAKLWIAGNTPEMSVRVKEVSWQKSLFARLSAGRLLNMSAHAVL
jgi:hypothetical protein